MTRNDFKNFDAYIFSENDCSISTQKKYETILCLGNGYLGMRSAFCEEMSSQSRLTLIAGLYDQQPNEVEELFPLPDATILNISVNSQKINPLHNNSKDYARELNLKNGLLTYQYTYTPDASNGSINVTQKRFVSLDNRHLAVFETQIKSNTDAEIQLSSLINARQTLNGTQHAFEEERFVLDNDILWYAGRAVVAGTKFRVASRMRIYVNNVEVTDCQRYSTSRRMVGTNSKIKIADGDEIRVVKYVTFYTANDADWNNSDPNCMKSYILDQMNLISNQDFDTLLNASEIEWAKRWNHCDIIIDSNDKTETLKTRMGMYHMIIMCPDHDDRNSVAAKGLTGPGYAGHVFWDSEIFNLPFFVYTDPFAAKGLCNYRYRSLAGAKNKAKEFGFNGAMYPWEAASHRGDEQCPTIANYSPENKLRYYSCGDIEHHVVVDVAYGAYNYAKITGDTEFFNEKVLEILFETADFWQSRLEYKADKNRYEICDVTGPDEYKEHVDNDVYTNYMVDWHLKTALYEIDRLQNNDPALFSKFEATINLTQLAKNINSKLSKLYLPTVNEDGLIPQNDTYLNLPQIDVDKYKNSGINRLIYRDYSIDQISEIMVSKQADLIQLFVLMPDLFPADVIKKNFDFYESKCLHDSSLSLSAYAIVASRIKYADLAHRFFTGALDTDFGETASTSDAGIHAANCGGIWQSIVFGFAGISATDEILTINPILPANWNGLSLSLFWHGAQIRITISKETVIIQTMNGVKTQVKVGNKQATVDNLTILNY